MESLTLRKVLIVDDESSLREIILDILQGEGIICDHAENGEIAFNMLQKDSYQCVLSDINMPVLNGLDCLLKCTQKNIMTPFIFFTGIDDVSNMLAAIRLGAIDFILKPFKSDDIINVVNKALEVGVRQQNIYEILKSGNKDILEKIQKEERIISLIRISNQANRSLAS